MLWGLKSHTSECQSDAWQVGVTDVTAIPSSPGVYVLGISDVFWTSYNASRLASIAAGNYISLESPTLNGGLKLTSNHVRPWVPPLLKTYCTRVLRWAIMNNPLHIVLQCLAVSFDGMFPLMQVRLSR